MKKRALCTLGLAVLMLFALVGCVDTPTEPVTEPTTTTTTTTTVTPPAEEASAPLAMTVVEEIPADGTLYTDPTVDTCPATEGS